MINPHVDNETISFLDEQPTTSVPLKPKESWKVLIVDDEESVHLVTRMVLSEVVFDGKNVELLSAYSAQEAKAMIATHPDTALMLLDLVMEQDDSGLAVIRHVRDCLHNRLVRIVLRTGQPGVAPEREIIVDYDIDGYVEKAELTAQKLFALVISMLRSYRDLVTTAELSARLQQEMDERAQAGLELCKSQQQLQAVMDNAPAVIFVKEPQGKYRLINRQFERLAHLDRSTFVGKSNADLPPKIAAAFGVDEHQVIETGKAVESERVISLPDGPHTFLSIEYPLFDTSGTMYSICGLATDITESKQAEKSLRESEERLRLKIDSILSPDVDIDVSKQELSNILDIPSIQSLMERFNKLTDLGMAILDLKGNVLVAAGWQGICTKFFRVHPETARNCRESDLHLAHNVKQGQFVAYRCKNGLRDVVTPLYIGGKHVGNVYTGQFFYEDEVTDTQKMIDLAVRCGFPLGPYLEALRRVPRVSHERVKLLMEYLGNFASLVSRLSFSNLKLAKAMSAQKRVESSLRESNELFRTLNAAAPIGIFRRDSQGHVIYANARCRKILRAGPQTAIETQVFDIVHPDDRPMVMAALEKNGEEVDLEHRILYQGEERWIKIRERPLYGESGRPIGTVGAIEDITGRKQAEAERDRLVMAAETANRAKDQFLAVLSHELRNPLAAIHAGVELMQRRGAGKSPATSRALEIIERNAKLQARLVDDLLDLSRVGRGKVALHRQAVKLDRIVVAAVQACRADAAHARVKLDVRAAPGLWANADVDRLQQVVMNLITNSIKFTPAGGRVSVEMKSEEGRGRISVEDTGIGIDPNRLSTVFQMFEQGEVSGQRAPGLGIGLALVKSLTEMQGGRVWAESDGPGSGSRFTVEIPLVEAPARRVSPGPPVTASKPIKVLLVEDNPDTRALLEQALAMLSYQVVATGSGEAALEVLGHETVKAILADIGLPGIDGYEFLRQARKMPVAERIPAFAITGYGQENDVRRAFEAGFMGHFVKPVDLEALDQQVRQAL